MCLVDLGNMDMGVADGFDVGVHLVGLGIVDMGVVDVVDVGMCLVD